MGLDFMLWFNIFIGVLLLYYAIKGSGKVYENDYPEAMKEDHSILLRKFCWIAGVPMLVLSILELSMQGNSYAFVISMISIFYVLGCVVVYLVIFRKRFKQYLTPPPRPPKK